MADANFPCPACGGSVLWETWRLDEALLSPCCGALLVLRDRDGILALDHVDADFAVGVEPMTCPN